MNIVPISAGDVSAESNWRDLESYDWIDTLPRRALAWEFLRRNGDYRRTFHETRIA